MKAFHNYLVLPFNNAYISIYICIIRNINRKLKFYLIKFSLGVLYLFCTDVLFPSTEKEIHYLVNFFH